MSTTWLTLKQNFGHYSSCCSSILFIEKLGFNVDLVHYDNRIDELIGIKK